MNVQVVVPVVIGDYHDILDGTYGGECVIWLKNYLNTWKTDPLFKGFAGDIVPNETEPDVGRIVLTSEGGGHVALVIAIFDDELVLAESNYDGDGVVHVGRRLSKTDKKIKGFFKLTTVGL